MTREYFEKSHYDELERKSEIVNSLSIPIGALTLVIGVFGFLVVNFTFSEAALWISGWFSIALVTTYFLGGFSVFFLLRAANGQTYLYLPNPRTIQDYIDELKNWYVTNEIENYEELFENDMNTFLVDNFIRCAETNFQCNIEKSRYRFLAHRFLNWSFVALFVGLPPFYINYRLNPPAQRIEIINSKRVTSMSEEKSAPAPKNVSPAKPASPKPKPPSPIAIREGKKPLKTK